MSDTLSKARQIAEVAFDKTQFQDRTRAEQEWDADISERAEKTRRLRTARLEREQSGKTIAALTARKHRITPA